MDYIEIKTAFDNEQEAIDMANLLLDKKLVACFQITKINSHYVWNGTRFHELEFLVFMKTKATLFEEIENVIKANHSYEVAELIATPICNISKEYANWIEENVSQY